MDFNVITESLKKGFNVWKENIVAYLVGYLIVVIIAGIISGVAFSLGAFSLITSILSGSVTGAGLGFVSLALGSLLLLLVVGPLGLGLFYMALKGTRGEKVEIKDIFYSFRSVSAYIRALIFLIVYALLAVIFSIIPIIGNIIFLILFFYTIYIYLMTPSEGILYALKESFTIAKDNLVMTIVALIVYYVLIFIGSLLFGIGLLITAPIALLFVSYVVKELKPSTKDES